MKPFNLIYLKKKVKQTVTATGVGSAEDEKTPTETALNEDSEIKQQFRVKMPFKMLTKSVVAGT